MAPDPSPQRSLAVHFNASRLRADTWNLLRDHACRIERASRTGADTAPLAAVIKEELEILQPIASYWVFPGRRLVGMLRSLFERQDWAAFAVSTTRVARLLAGDAYRGRDLTPILEADRRDLDDAVESLARATAQESRPYFEVLVVDDLPREEEAELRRGIRSMRREDDELIYEPLIVPSFEDALVAVMFNFNIQACLIRYGFPFRSPLRHNFDLVEEFMVVHPTAETERGLYLPRGPILAHRIKQLRPELDLYLTTDAPVEEVAGKVSTRDFRRVFYQQEDYRELHLSILKGVRERYQTPFFDALKQYSHKPTGVFHALPISRGKSIARSHWIQDMGRFYGERIFLAETSSTLGGLDSLLDPKGSIRDAQRNAARAFGAQQTFFVTNGTSTANKIVTQALVRPGDVMLLSHDCHKSHPYAAMLTGARAVYMDPYPLDELSMYGGVPIETIKRHLLAFRREGKLDQVKLLLLTNCTFDGVVYDVERVMEEVLAIKPDMVFLWDEAWYAFAACSPNLRGRTAMPAARRIKERLRSAEHRERWLAQQAALEAAGDDDEAWVKTRLVPPPEARVRVYATQSTHKSLTSLRQGSMIHVFDDDFDHLVEDAFHESYMTHTSTSPNYQILASLDVGRRQVELEGYELVQKSLELAVTLRERIALHPDISRYFRILGPADLVPDPAFRPSGLSSYVHPESGWSGMWKAWKTDEFVVDPTRVTVHVGHTGIDGETIRRRLIDQHDIQINKTSRNTVLFLIHIGVTRGAIAYLIEVLAGIARELDEQLELAGRVERKRFDKRVAKLTTNPPPLPNFSRFHDRFRPDPESPTPEGDIRAAFYLAYDPEAWEYLEIGGPIEAALAAGRELVSAAFVTPYPPGFPILVPGQIITDEIIRYMKALDIREIHGYQPDYGLRVFTEEALRPPA